MLALVDGVIIIILECVSDPEEIKAVEAMRLLLLLVLL